MPRPSSREQIVESALREFHLRGFNGCSVEDITKAAGVPKGSFYNHFGSKQELAAETVRRYRAGSAWRATNVDGLTPLANLRARFEAQRGRFVDRGLIAGCLLGNFGAEVSDQAPAVRAELHAALAGWSDDIATLIRQAQAAGEVPPARDPDLLGRFLVNAWEGAVTRAKVDKSVEALDDFFSTTFGVLLA
jgi:TetR/AcrR family transcriptional repressor of nem operon